MKERGEGESEPNPCAIALRMTLGSASPCSVAIGTQRIPAGAAARGVFARLLAMPDPQLAAYLLGQDLPRDPALAALVQQIRRFPPAGGEGG